MADRELSCSEVLNQRLLSFFKLTGQHIGLNGIEKLPTLEILIFWLCFDWDLGAVLAFSHGI